MFSGARVRQARELRLLTQQELARRIGKSQAAVTHIERGFKQASPEFIAAVAQHTRLPVAFFAADPAVEFPIEVLLFRARSSMTRRDALSAARYAEIIFEMWTNLAQYATTLPSRLEKSTKPPAQAARESRVWLGLSPDQPVPHLVNSMERAGLMVIQLPTQQDDIDAFSAWIEGHPVVALCGGKVGDRKRWNAAHELGHLVLHSDGKIRSEEHKQADVFAAELLLPEHAMRKEIVAPVTLTSLAALKPRWGVSIQALIYRSHELGIITDRQYRYLFEQLSIRGWKTREPHSLDIPTEKPRALRKMVEVSPFKDNPQRLAAQLRLSTECVGSILEGYDHAPVVPEKQIVSNKVIALKPRHNRVL